MSFARFHPYPARWRYSDPDLGRMSVPVEVLGRPNADGEALCRVTDTHTLRRLCRITDVTIPVAELAALDSDCGVCRVDGLLS